MELFFGNNFQVFLVRASQKTIKMNKICKNATQCHLAGAILIDNFFERLI